MTGDEILCDPGKIDEGTHENEPIEWWYYNAIISAPGTPIDGWAFVTIYTIARNIAENVHGLLISPDGETIDLSGYELTPGSIKTSSKDVDISWEGNWCKGKYPEWQVYFSGEYNGKTYRVELNYKADVSSNFYTYRFGHQYLYHFVVFRNRATGKISINDQSYPVTGTGYYEHFFGFLDFLSSKGWYWYWCPKTKKDGLAINIGLSVQQDYSIPAKFMQFTPDGKNFFQFDDFEFEILNEKEFGGIIYPVKFRISEKKSEGDLYAVIKRSASAYHRLNETPLGNAAFITGFAHLSGKLFWQGKEYDLEGDAFGSAMLFSFVVPQ